MGAGRCQRDLLFFFQAEDGIRDLYVTGVQTCALPISRWSASRLPEVWKSRSCFCWFPQPVMAVANRDKMLRRSEERRVGKECRARWMRHHEKKKTALGVDGGGHLHVEASLTSLVQGST